MNYYQLRHSSEEAEIGHFPQAPSAKGEINYNSPYDLSKYFWKRLDNSVKLTEPVCHAKAIATDLISCITISIDLVVSERLRDLLIEDFVGRMDIAEVKVHYRNTALNYWLIHPYKFENEFVDFENSEVWRVGRGTSEINRELVFSNTEFMQLVNSVKPPEAIVIKKLTLSSSLDIDFFALRNVYGGIRFYVSERKKKVLEANNCTGLRFEKV